MHIPYLIALVLSTLSTLTLADQLPLSVTVDMDDFTRASSAPTLFDTLMLQRSSSIFFDYIRETSALHQRVSDVSTQSTLLVPTNKAVVALGWKPNHGPPPKSDSEKIGITEASGRENVERWLGAHLLPTSDIDFSAEGPHETLLNGKSITFTKISDSEGDEEWKKYGVVQDDEVVAITGRLEACNGVIYIVNGTISIV